METGPSLELATETMKGLWKVPPPWAKKIVATQAAFDAHLGRL
jgi:hypothetical protein